MSLVYFEAYCQQFLYIYSVCCSGGEVVWWVCLSVCVSVCLFVRRSLPNLLCMLRMSVARSSSGTLTIGNIGQSAGRGDGSADRGQSVTYDCLVDICRQSRRPLPGPAMPLKRKSRGWPRYGRLRSPRRRTYLYGQVRWSWTWWRRRRWRRDWRFRSRNSHCFSDRYRNRRSAFIFLSSRNYPLTHSCRLI